MFTSWLYAPDRMDWVKHPEKRPAGCVFCRIGKSPRPQEHFILKKSGGFFVVMNIYPYNTGHLQVIPLRHVSDLEELSDAEVGEMFVLVRKSMKLLKMVLDPVGFNVGLNQGGSVSGASIEHLHVHIVPRYKTDFGFIDVIGGTKVLPEELGKTYKRLMKEAKMLE
jgi:diadenosine tetraphosphate (Ap4A) HIT family hydrolase